MPERFICIKKCFIHTIYEEGTPLVVAQESDIPPSVRPFFVRKSEAEQIRENADFVEFEAKQRQEVMNELDRMGLVYDRRWDISKLRSTLQIAKRDMPEVSDIPPPAPETASDEPGPGVSDEPKYPSQMNKVELQEFARSLNIEFTEDHTKAELRSMIDEAQKVTHG